MIVKRKIIRRAEADSRINLQLPMLFTQVLGCLRRTSSSDSPFQYFSSANLSSRVLPMRGKPRFLADASSFRYSSNARGICPDVCTKAEISCQAQAPRLEEQRMRLRKSLKSHAPADSQRSASTQTGDLFGFPKVKSRNAAAMKPATPGLPLGGVCISCLLSSTLFGRSSDLQATYLLQLPSPWLNQCLGWSVRSCLPLRGSSGFSPDSLLSLTSRIRHRKVI